MSLLGAMWTPRPVALALRRCLLPVVLAGLLAGCGIAANDDVQPSAAIAPQASLSTTLELCRNDVSGALGAAGLNLVPPTSAARPAEAPLLMAAPRTVGQVILPGDPTHGYIVMYQFPDPASAYAAAMQQAAYVAGGEGTIQFLPDSRFTLRQDGSCV
ncbi:MAG: hypothetical protein ACRDGQ_06050, partial [Candidatus Limnocylindrales bacterium]